MIVVNCSGSECDVRVSVETVETVGTGGAGDSRTVLDQEMTDM